MSTHIDIDEKLLKKAMKATKLKTKKATVNAALEALIKMEARQKLRKMSGNVKLWNDIENQIKSSRQANQ